MAESIIDGTGKGYEAQVDSEGRLVTFSVTEVEDKYVNRDGRQWSVPVSVTPVGANDVFFTLENTGSVTLAITDVRSFCASAGEIIVMKWASGTATRTSPTTITAVPKNGGSSAVPVATIVQDTNTTSLVDEGTIYQQVLDTANKLDKLTTSSNIIIPQGAIFTMTATTGTALITSIVSIVELD